MRDSSLGPLQLAAAQATTGFPSPDWLQQFPATSPSPRWMHSMASDDARGQVVVFGGVVPGGVVETWTWDGTNWTKRAPATSPPLRLLTAMTYDAARSNVVLFSGDRGGADTWIWDGTTWTQRAPANPPAARSFASMAYDSTRNRVVLFGGQAQAGTASGVFNDTWTWDGTAWTRVNTPTSPPARAAASMAFDPLSGKMVLFGGIVYPCGSSSACNGVYTNDTWTFDGTNWVQVAPATSPSPRGASASAYHGGLRAPIIFGGSVPGAGGVLTFTNETWMWDSAANTWRLATGIASPPGRTFAVMAFHAAAGKLVVFGGVNSGPTGNGVLGDTWAYGTLPTTGLTTDRAANPLYSRGETVTFTLTVGNPSLATMTGVNVLNTLVADLVAALRSVLIAGTGCGPPTVCNTNAPGLRIENLTVPALSSVQITFNATAVGVDRACSKVVTSVQMQAAAGTTPTLSTGIVVCDTGLGLEDWYSYVQRDVGPQAVALANAGNGNLVLQATDSTPVQAHGQLAYVLRRTYNSQAAVGLVNPNLLAAGWTLNLSGVGGDLGAGLGNTRLYVPGVSPLVQALNPLSMTFIDRDGTRHVFTSRGLPTPIDVATASGPLADVVPRVLDPTRLCIDTTYAGPAGVHLSLWRYVRPNVGVSCAAANKSNSVIAGFAAIDTDRVRYEFNDSGQLLELADANGNALRHLYDASGRLTTVYEPGSCTDPNAAGSACRAFRFTYPTLSDSTTAEMDVFDPAGRPGDAAGRRPTRYMFKGIDAAMSPATRRLVSVENPDSTTVSYAYQGDATTPPTNCGGDAGQLCSATDPAGKPTSFAYLPGPQIDAGIAPASVLVHTPNRLASITDRRLSATTIAYSSAPDFTVADQAGHRQLFVTMDTGGRVRDFYEGDTLNNFLRHSTLFWDTDTVRCRQPDNLVDNNLCRVQRQSFTTYAPDADVSYVYNAEGKLLAARQANSPTQVADTFGYEAQYVAADGNHGFFKDSPQGSGSVASESLLLGGRATSQTVYVLSDRTQALTPRGNAAGLLGYQPYITIYKVDSNRSVAPNRQPGGGGGTCANPAAPTANTGNVCEVVAPAFDAAGSLATVTRFTYDGFGQRATMTTPKTIAETPVGQTPASYLYTYYVDGDRDLSGGVSAGGWLKGVTDPFGKLVAFAYDRAGNPVRTWDRNATRGLTLAVFPGTIAAPPSPTFSETLMACRPAPQSCASGTTSYSAPWRYVGSSRDAVGNLSTYKVDGNGNSKEIRPPRGNAVGNGSFDITLLFDDGDNPISRQMPAEAAAGKKTTWAYDALGNMVAETDPVGHVRTYYYDTVNRQVADAFTRGPWPADTSTVPPACRQSTAADAPLPAGRILCLTVRAFDGHDDLIVLSDPNAQATYLLYDAVGRQTVQADTRNNEGLALVWTSTTYDPDGNPTSLCSGRQVSEGGQAAGTVCPASPAFGESRTYDFSGRLRTSVLPRAGIGTFTSTYAYDADGNPASVSDANNHTTTYGYDVLDRMVSTAVPRDTTTFNTTARAYDPAGNVTAVTRPGGLITAYSYDAANRSVDEVVGAQSTDASPAGGLVVDVDGTRNIRTRVVYDPDGNVVASFEPRAFTGGAGAITNPDTRFMSRFDYDANGRMTAQFAPRYDRNGGPIPDATGLGSTQSTQCPQGPGASPPVPAYVNVGVCVTRYVYEPDSTLRAVVLPTSLGLNGSGAFLDQRHVDYAYTDDHKVATVNIPSPVTGGGRVVAATYLYDALGRLLKTTDALGHQSTKAYSGDGLLARTEAQSYTPAGGPAVTHVATYGYDANGNGTRATSPAGVVERASFFSDDLAATVVDGAGDTTAYLYDPVGMPLFVYSPAAIALVAPNPSGTPTANTFTFDNLLASSTAPVAGDGSLRRRTTYGYDPAGRKTSQATATVTAAGVVVNQGGTQQVAWHPNDRLSSETGRGGETITWAYDAAGGPTRVTDSTAGGSTVTGTWYLDGQARTVTATVATTPQTTTYAYDGSGQRSGRADTAGTSTLNTTYAYNDIGLATNMVSAVGGTVNWGYDAAGRMATETDGVGTSGLTTTAYAFFDDDTLSVKRRTASGGALIADWSYRYDGDFRQTSETFSGMRADTQQVSPVSTFAYGYDTAGRLSQFNDGTGLKVIGWDRNSNRTRYGARTYTYNADDSLASALDPSVSASPRPHTYDPTGRLTSDGCMSYTHDGFDRLGSATGQLNLLLGCPLVPPSSTFAYDGLNRQRSHAEPALLPLSTTRMSYDGWTSSVSAEATTALLGAGTNSYGLDPAGNPKAVLQTSTAQRLADDGRRNIATVTNTAGSPTCTVRFDPFGEPVTPAPSGAGANGVCQTASSAGSNGDLYYRSFRRDAIAGQYQFGARTYDPRKAAFLTADAYRAVPRGYDLSIGVDPLTRNSYSYVNGDPLNFWDPSGHKRIFGVCVWNCEKKNDPPKPAPSVDGAPLDLSAGGLIAPPGGTHGTSRTEILGGQPGSALIGSGDCPAFHPTPLILNDDPESDRRNISSTDHMGAITQCPERVYGIVIGPDGQPMLDPGVTIVKASDGGGGGKGNGKDSEETGGWPEQSADQDCSACATKIQLRVGGEVEKILPGAGGRVLGESTNNPSGNWGYHDVVVKDGRVYDSFTGPQGLTIDQYKAQFKYADVIEFGF